MTRRPAALPCCGTRLRAVLLPAALAATLLAGCATQPQPPQVTPIQATIKLGRITERTFLSRVDVNDSANYGANYGGYGVGVGAAGVGGGSGGGVGLGFSVDLSRLLNKQPPPQIDLFQYKVQAQDGTVATVNAPALPALEPGACVRLIYPDGGAQPRIAPSNEC